MVNFVIELELTAPTVEAVMTAVAVENIGSAFALLAYEDTFERAEAIGAKGFVDKPFHRVQLLKVFEQALG